MENKIKEVQAYFKNKMLKGEFEVLSIEEYYTKIQIDDKYKFHLWGGYNPDSYPNKKLWTATEENFILFDFTIEERDLIFHHIKPLIKSVRLTETRS